VHLTGDADEQTVEAARAWDPLGFGAQLEDPELPSCERRWYDAQQYDCQISIFVVVDPEMISRGGPRAMADRAHRAIWIDASVSEHDARYALAHEVGHIVLDTKLHVAHGVMGGQTHWLTADDRALACESIGVCL